MRTKLGDQQYVKKLHVLHAHLPQLCKPPVEATSLNMAQVSMEGDDYTMLSAALNRKTNVLEFPADHDIWHATQARSNILRGALSAKAGRTSKACSVKEMLSSSSFRERFAQAKKNIN